jgi:hypothetical protein
VRLAFAKRAAEYDMLATLSSLRANNMPVTYRTISSKLAFDLETAMYVRRWETKYVRKLSFGAFP